MGYLRFSHTTDANHDIAFHLGKSLRRPELQFESVVDWHRFDPTEWDIEYDIEKLGAYGVADWEAAEVIWSNFLTRPNKKAHGPNRYQLLGRTDAGRTLKLIVQISGERSMRVITGWRV